MSGAHRWPARDPGLSSHRTLLWPVCLLQRGGVCSWKAQWLYPPAAPTPGEPTPQNSLVVLPHSGLGCGVPVISAEEGGVFLSPETQVRTDSEESVLGSECPPCPLTWEHHV